ncbi:MAG TPA: DUF4493 domain-containing protein [Bacteroidales bacterium]|nr:DUF4493 domain-containing protein [Bacteroidales bacterium]
MKTKPLVCVILILLSSVSCHKDDPAFETMKGTLSLHVGLFISVNEEPGELKSTLAGEDFNVTIFTSSGSQVMAFDRAADIPDEIMLNPGNYYVTAQSANNLPAAFSNPYYYGESEVFTISSGQLQTVTVTCELANIMVSMVYADQIKTYYSDFSTLVSTSAGSLTYTKEETRIGYFQPLPVNIAVTLTRTTQTGTETKTLTGSIPDPKPRRHYEIHVNAMVEGSAAFTINVTEGEDSLQIVNINEGEEPQNGVFAQGDLLITEIMYDPVALTDTYGEWIEIYNNTTESIDLGDVVIRKGTTEHHTINGPLMLAAGAYAVLARSETALSGNKYVYGSSLSLNNTGTTLSLYNYGTDGTDGSLIFAVDYSQSAFPGGTGASIGLSPLKMNKEEAILGSSWCVSKSAYSTGDLGTPGTVNDSCE